MRSTLFAGLATIAAIAFAVLTMAAPTFLSVGQQAFFAAVSLVILGLTAGICIFIAPWKVSFAWRILLALMLVGFLLFGALAIYEKLAEPAKSADIVDKTTASPLSDGLGVTLVIEDVMNPDLSIHFKVSNSSNQPATLTNPTFNIPGKAKGVPMESGPFTVKPGKPIALPATGDNQLIDFRKIELRFDYRFRSGEKGQGYASFNIPANPRPNQEIEPTNCCKEDTPVNLTSDHMKELESVLNRSQGGFDIKIDQRDGNGMPAMIEVGTAPGKIFHYDYSRHTVGLISGPVGRRFGLVSGTGRNDLGQDVISARWNDDQSFIEMWVDGHAARRIDGTAR